MPTSMSTPDRQALVTLQRAAATIDPVHRVGALWEAIEFYVGKLSPDAQFNSEEIASTVAGACGGLSEKKAARVASILRRSLNQFSIKARLQHVLAQDGVPVSTEDLALLGRLRDARNKALHGSTAAPAHEDIDRAVAFVSRVLMTRHRRAR